MKIDAKVIQNLLVSLAKDKHIFCSEMDFQLHLAWLMKKEGFELSLEYDPGCLDANAALDIMIWKPERVAVELKYKTALFQPTVFDYPLRLKNQGAQDIGRYDFFKDISRVERVVAERKAEKGFSILLTNDRSYWRTGRNGTADEMFRIYDGRTVKLGPYHWGSGASPGTKRGREKPITLIRDHVFGWNDYAKWEEKNGRFRFLVVDVERELLLP